MTSPTEFTVHCPECDSTKIYEKNMAYAEMEVWDWDLDGRIPVPSDVDTDVSADWEVSDARNQYTCHGCGIWEGNLNDLVVKSASLPTPGAPQE